MLSILKTTIGWSQMFEDVEEYRAEFDNRVAALASVGGRFTADAFISEVAARLTEAEEVNALVPCFYSGEGSRGRKLRIDGYDLDDEDGHLVLAVADFQPGDQQPLGSADVTRLFNQAQAWAEGALDGSLLDQIEESSTAYQLAADVFERRASIFKVRVYLVTNRRLSSRLKQLPSVISGQVTFDFHPWDIERFMRVEESALGREEIDIDVQDWAPEGIPFLRAGDTAAGVETYLAILPGDVLAGIYSKYGARVLESNVRSFLSTRGKVNKAIRGTILQTPEFFLTFNNGITATASEISVGNIAGESRIVGIRDLQIVNGGQTTASIFYVKKDDKTADLRKVFVQMKLVVVSGDIEADLVPTISRSANTQNTVSEADFFSNHPFHQRMEEKSRRILAPAVAGIRYQQKWFYERTRGQYQSERSKLGIAASRKFEAEYPRDQVVTKTDAAKYLMTWLQKPNVVSAGAQKNFLAFANYVDPKWTSNPDQFGDGFFKSLVAKGILFNAIRKQVMKSEWYTSGYLANIVTYTMAKLATLARTSTGGGDLDFEAIWTKQSVDDGLLDVAEKVAREVFEVLTAESRPVLNVTEWAKREKCWDLVRELRIDVGESLAPYLRSGSDVAEGISEERKDQRELSDIEAQTQVANLGNRYWYNLREFAKSQKIVTEKELSILRYAVGEAGKIASGPQSQVLLDLDTRAKQLGFVGN